MPAHPTWEQVQAEYETVWQVLDGRPIESLIDLPLMTDPELQAAMRLLSVLAPPAYFTDFHLNCLMACRMAKVGMQHGVSEASAARLCLCGDHPRSSLSPLQRGLPISLNSPATSSTSTALSARERKST